jgi:hypothetical protein
MAPSGQDIKNAVIGIVIILIAGIVILWSNIPLIVNALFAVTGILGTGISLGLVFVLIAFIVSLPLIIIYIKK